MQELVDDFIVLNSKGLVLALCEKYYDENVLMLNNDEVFAKSMKEAYDKQESFVSSIETFEAELLTSKIEGNVSDLTFHYKIVGQDAKVIEFTGRHIQTWENGKIVKEAFYSE
jgi:uncharacterized protein (UPF0335 family)